MADIAHPLCEGVPAELATFLRQRVGRIPHTSNTLLDHLVGTHRLLRGWESEPDVCVAGLFHSIYGTPDFTLATIDPQARGELADVIGNAAEVIVFRFCTLGHRGALSAAARGVSDADEQLGELALANFVEQSPRMSVSVVAHLLERDKTVWCAADRKMRAPVSAALHDLYSRFAMALR